MANARQRYYQPSKELCFSAKKKAKSHPQIIYAMYKGMLRVTEKKMRASYAGGGECNHVPYTYRMQGSPQTRKIQMTALLSIE